MSGMMNGLMNDKKKFSNTQKPSLSVVGCGWLGLPLATQMAASGYLGRGSTTREEKLETLSNAGIEPFIFDSSTKPNANNALFQTDMLILNIPPGRRNPDLLKDYPKLIASILDALKTTDLASRIIFISSTSVYPEDVEWIDEETPVDSATDSGKAIFVAEKIVECSGFPWVVLRFGGLAGPARHPGRFLAGKKELTYGEQAVNFLHLRDAIEIVRTFIENPGLQGCFNCVAPVHPMKKDFYSIMSKAAGLDAPEFDDSHKCFKREISSHKLINEAGYRFKFPDPLKFVF